MIILLDKIVEIMPQIILLLISGIISYLIAKMGIKAQIKQLQNKRLEEQYIKILKELYKLKKYYELFINPGNEFKKSENPENFGPLVKIEEFEENIEESLILFGEEENEIIDKVRDLLGCHCSMALSIASYNYECIDNNSKELYQGLISNVENISENTVKGIDESIIQLKKIMNKKLYEY